MSFDDPFGSYTLVLRVIVYGVVPLFTIVQFVRLKRGLHVFQLEGYRRGRFIRWCRSNRGRALFLRAPEAKKTLVMTGRAWRILVVATALVPLAVLVPAGLAHVGLGGWPADVLVWGAATAIVFVAAPWLLVIADVALVPVQRAINAAYSGRARRRLQEIRPVVVGVTGSFGKTSTKFAIEGLVAEPGAVLATPRSFNVPLGIVRTINEQLEPSHRYFIVEMGAYGVGEIAELCRLANPSIGVLTAVGPAHLERFGSMDNIRRAKYELIEHLPADGLAVMNVDDPEVRALADGTSHVEVVRYGLEPEGAPDVTARDLSLTPAGTAMTIVEAFGESIAVETRLLGRHSVGHVLAGVAVARHCGRLLRDLVAPIKRLEPVEHRLQLIEGAGGVTVIDDAYNSNPEGAAAALDVLAAMPARSRVVVTPGMIELGDLQFEANRVFGRRAAEIADTLIVVAPVNRDALVTGAGEGRAEVVVVDSLSRATEALKGRLAAGDVVLFENDLPDQFEA